MADVMRLKNARLVAGLTQEELAEKVGVEPSTVCLWETNKTKPAPKRYKMIADALKMPTKTIVEIFSA